MRRHRYWIFDLDGTLTRPKHDFMAIRRQLGVPLEQGILEFIAEQPEADKASLNARLETIERQVAEDAELAPGAGDLLDLLFRRGCRLGILTRNSRPCVEITLECTGIGAFFGDRDIVCRDDARPKPDAHGIEKLLTRWRAPKALSVMVGDYLFDLQAGRSAGIATIHYNGKRGETWAGYSDLVVHDFSELHALLGGP